VCGRGDLTIGAHLESEMRSRRGHLCAGRARSNRLREHERNGEWPRATKSGSNHGLDSPVCFTLQVRLESRNGGAQVSGRIIPKLQDAWVSIECCLDDPALHAQAAPVNQADFTQAGRGGGIDVVVDDSGYVARRE